MELKTEADWFLGVIAPELSSAMIPFRIVCIVARPSARGVFLAAVCSLLSRAEAWWWWWW